MYILTISTTPTPQPPEIKRTPDTWNIFKKCLLVFFFLVYFLFIECWCVCLVFFLSNSHAHARWTLHQNTTPPRLSLYNLFNNRQKYYNKCKFSLIFARQVSYSLTLIYPFDDSASVYMRCANIPKHPIKLHLVKQWC